MVPVPAVWPGAVHRSRPELAAFVQLVADLADGGESRDFLRRVIHDTRQLRQAGRIMLGE